MPTNYFRDYDPETGRYVESDPIGLAGGLNTFSYAYGNPVNLIDPNGLAGTTVDAYCLRYGPQACADVTGGSATSGSINATGISLWCLLTKTCSANESSAQNEKKPKDCPPGTKDIDKAKNDYGWDKDTLHGIKSGAHAG
ncbi:RHS repeat-associated core domain-containing protein [Pseudomonas aeruginosa]